MNLNLLMKNKLLILFKFLVLLVIMLNLVIVLSGRFYLYKGVWNTYLKGKSGPSIYDLNVFHNRTVQKGSKPFHFINSKNNKQLLPEEEEFMKEMETHSFMVIRNDTILFEQYFDNQSQNAYSNSFSAAKTVVGLLIGCAIDEGKIKSVDEPVHHYIPVFKENGKENITIKDLLTMSSGLSWEESGKNPFSDNAASYYGTDLFKLSVNQRVLKPSGKEFHYQSGSSQLLGFVIQEATGKTVSDYFSEKIWSKIGAESDAFWSLDKKNGDEKSFCCLYANTHDFAKLARLILHKGNWNGETLISEAYMKDFATPAQLSTEEGIPNTRYGYQIWLYPDEENPIIYCRGILGQYFVALPAQNAIVVRTGMKRGQNITLEEAKGDLLKVGHPKDFFTYMKIAERIVSEK